MAVVRLRLGGRDWGDLQQLPFAPRPSRDPLGLKRSVLELLAENIAVNSSAALEQSRDAPGTVLYANFAATGKPPLPPVMRSHSGASAGSADSCRWLLFPLRCLA